MTVHDLPARQVHERALDLAAVALDFALSRAETAELEAHLASCPSCARRAAAMRGDALALGRPLELLPSARVDAAIAAEIAGRRAGPQRLVLVAAAAMLALALLGAAAVGAYLLRNSPTPPITEVTLPTATPVARPDASPVAIGEIWGTIEFDPGSGGSIEAVTFSGADLIGVGGGACVPVGQAPTQCYGGAWTAPAGGRWVRASDQPGLEVGPALRASSPQAGMLDAAAGPSGTVAIGYADDGRARVWRSTDGRTWQRTEFDPGSSPVVLRLAAIEASPAGFVIVGWAVDSQTLRARAAAWTSPDGVTWTRAEDTADMDVGPCFEGGSVQSCGGMTGVVATASGYVAVGSDHARAAGTEPGRPAAWTSPDGMKWTQANAGLDFVGALSDVDVGGSGLVAVGSICPPECHSPLAGAVAATSVDGSTWSFRKIDGAVGGQHLASVDGRVFALGVLYQDADPFAELELWQTDDGMAWQRVTTLPSTTDANGGADIAAANGRVVIVGWQSVTGVDGMRNFAYSSPPLAAASTPDTSPRPDASIGVTQDTWKTVGIPASDTGSDWIGLMKAVTVTESGFVAVGPPVCAPQDDPTTCHTSVWTATQGGNWIRAIDQPSLRVSPDFPTSGPSPAMSDVTAGPGGLVAIGYDTDPQARGPAVWRSTDGRTWTRVDQAFGSKPAERLNQRVAAVASDARGYVIVGHVIDYAGGPADVTARAAAWTSPDGLTWTHATDTADMDVGACLDTSEEPGCGGMLAVTATDTGYIAVGQAAPGSDEGPRPAAWKSSDGIDWVRIDAGLGFSGRLDAATGIGGRVVATGRLCTGSRCSGVDVVSSDEVNWRFAAVDGAPWEGAALTSAGDSVVGIAWNLDDGAYQVWRTTDGLTRERIEALPLPAGFHAFESADIAASGERILVVGWVNVTVPPDDSAFGPVNVSFQSP